jgi:D-apionolactonase
VSLAWISSKASELQWSSGHWSVKLRGDEFAEISFNGQVLLRSVRALIRDQNWGTPEFIVKKVSESPNQLEVEIASEGFDSHFAGSVKFEIKNSTAEIGMALTCSKAFSANRIGLNVLIPPALAGTELLVHHSDQSQDKTNLPVKISPHQPVFDISALAWRQAGLEVKLEFSGDVFEMEDQRNWTDASYKVYSRPLSLPFPYPLAVGEQITQKLLITVDSEGATEAQAKQKNDDKVLLKPAGIFPSIQLGASSAPTVTGGNFDTNAPGAGLPVLVEVDLNTQNWKAALERAAKNSSGIDLRVICDAGVTASTLNELLDSIASLNILRIAIFDSGLHVSTGETNQHLKQLLDDRGMNPKLIVGARSHFTELNRNFSDLPETGDGLTFSISPLFHALNTEQLVESIAMQRLVASQAVDMAGGKEVHVGPITLRPRFNNVATEKPEIPDVSDLSIGYGAEWFGGNDARQQSPELAAWLVASAAATSVPGVHSLTYFEQWGPRGVESGDGITYPVSEAINILAEMTGRPFLSGSSPDGLIWALNFVSGEANSTGNLLLVANLRGQGSEVQLEVGGKSTVVNLDPYSWQRILT